MPSELSGGMKKRVALARAIVRDIEAANPDQVRAHTLPNAAAVMPTPKLAESRGLLK